MPKVEQSIEVEVPVRIAYDQWTQFEEFPKFMDGVDEVRQLNAGVVTFGRLKNQRCKIMLRIEWASEGLVERLGGALGRDDRQIKSDLQRFKELVESRGTETGGWGDEVEQGVRRRSSRAGAGLACNPQGLSCCEGCPYRVCA